VECIVGDKLVKLIVEDNRDLKQGKEFFLEFNREKFHLFDKASGRALT
jgi:hypothetical protein